MSRTSLLLNLLICILVFSLATAWASQVVVIADFSFGVDKNGIPSGWQLKEKSGTPDFSIVKDGNTHALHLRSVDTSFAFQKPVTVSTRQYPMISWKWKVMKLPGGGDFRKSKTDDQAAQLFVAFSNKKVIGYIWDTNAPKGLVGNTWVPPLMIVKAIVVRSGPSETGKWITETRNAYKDYKKLFGHDPPPVAGIRIQINTQHTETSAESLFADVEFKKSKRK